MVIDYFAVLGVSSNATHEEIVRAYRARAKLYHPDRNPGFVEEANRRLQELNTAYEALSDLQRRQAHAQRTGPRAPEEQRPELAIGTHPGSLVVRPSFSWRLHRE